MRLLLDENLSRRLVPLLQAVYPDSTQVTLIGLERASDFDIWEFAQQNSFVIVTRDADFYELSLQSQHHVPKVIWLRVLNVSKEKMLDLLLKNRELIEEQLIKNEKICVQIY